SYTYEIEYMDEHLGRLIEGLKKRDLYRDTLIVFTADHGEEFFEHGGWWHGLSLYEEQIAVPLIIKLPNSELIDVNTDLTRHVDIAPTIATIAGLDLSEQWQGKSLLSSSLDFENADTPYVHSHLNFEGIELHSLRTESRKLIHANEGNKRGYAPVELYDLDADPTEQENLAELSEAEVTLFSGKLGEMNAFILENAAEPLDMSLENLPQSMKEELEALGYLGDVEGEEEVPQF
ncbi:MAG: sulfatase-like hydrolase/transferase, partial [Candidatus Hydrogenedentota bacterium]